MCEERCSKYAKMSCCSICVEKLNKSTRLPCKCPHCEYTVCRSCLQTFILTREDYEVSCMNCKKIWTYDTLDALLTKNFRNSTLKAHREKVLLDREKSLLPATQAEVQRIKTIKMHESSIDTLIEMRASLLNDINDIRHQILLLQQGEGASASMKERRAFTINCPRTDCRGFVANTSWECGVCNHYVCSKCHEYIGEKKDVEHTCKEENVQTAAMIKKDSKPCPGCSTLIFKISGCNQMWCTQCHTTFSWSSGAIITGTVHNPHFYEWMQQNGNGTAPRNLGDVPCGGLLSVFQLRAILVPLGPQAKEIVAMFSLHQISSHVENVTLPHHHTNNVTNNLDLRVKYLMNEITEDHFKATLQQREKKNIKKKEIHDVLEMYLFTSVDMFNNMLSDKERVKKFCLQNVDDYVKQFLALQEFANTQLDKIATRYNCKVPYIKLDDSKRY